jgi:hypothetical protein
MMDYLISPISKILFLIGGKVLTLLEKEEFSSSF